MAESNTSICKQSLAKIGAKTIVNFEDATESSTQAIECRLHFVPTRDALIRSHSWRFARDRKVLSQDVTDPVGTEYDNQFILPVDFLAMRSIYEGRFSDENIASYSLEGQRLLTNDSTMEIRYVKKVTDASKFDPLFVELFVLKLARKLISLAGANPPLKKEIDDEVKVLMRQVRAMDRQETNTIGTADLETWNDVRYNG